MMKMAKVLKLEPLGKPGLLHQIDEFYFKRIEAVEFSVKMDDGQDPRSLPNADIVLDRRDDVLAVHEALLQFEDDGIYVEVERAPQQFERRAIETGLSDGISIEVVSGLEEGDRLKAGVEG